MFCREGNEAAHLPFLKAGSHPLEEDHFSEVVMTENWGIYQYNDQLKPIYKKRQILFGFGQNPFVSCNSVYKQRVTAQ